MQEESLGLFVQQLARHQSRLRGFVRCLLVRAADVDDILQEVNVVLWEKADEFVVGTNFWAWASQSARFKVLNHVRKLGRDRLVFDDAILEQLAETAASKLDQLERRREALEHCLNQLPPPQRQLIDLRYAGDRSIESIAETISRPVGSVRQTLYRIRVTLQSCIESQLAQGVESP